MTSTSARNAPGRGPARLWAALVWLAVWQAASWVLGQRLLLPSPAEVLLCLGRMAATAGYWQTLARSAGRILCGFLAALTAGAALAALSARYRAVRTLLHPLVAAVKAVPVVSFIILALVWLPSRRLSVFISALMAFPVIYLNLLEGAGRTDPQLLEMARVFRVPLLRRLRDLYIPQVLPWLRSACSLGMGLCWKSGAAAEVIGLPAGTVGEGLYHAKIYLETPELFAWTVSIVAAAAAMERLTTLALDRLEKRGERR